MIGWLADLFRLAWGLLYWNSAKTRFRLRGGRCPCQSPSDSGRAMETTCEASLTWHHQKRFHRVCPLLQRTPSGELRCSVDTADVRPFWPRAFVIYGCAIFALYLIATTGYFALQRTIGVPVSYVTIAYPPHWPRLDLARSRYFAQRADHALSAGKIGDAQNSLTLAYSLDPTNYAAGLKLATLYQIAQPTLSDDIFARLLHEHAALRAATATAWYQALLLRGDFATIIPLATTALTVDAPHEAAWIHALLFALRRGPIEKLEKLTASLELPATSREILALELVVRTQPPDQARARLRQTSLTSPYFDYFRVSRLIELGFSQEAATLLRASSHLSQRDRITLSLASTAALNRPALLENEIDQLLASPPGPALCEILAVHLIRHPDRSHLAKLFSAIASHPLPATDAGRRAINALLCTAGVNQDTERFREALTMIQASAGDHFRSRAAIESFFLKAAKNARIENILPALQPLSAELNYALLDHYDRTPLGDTPPLGLPHPSASPRRSLR